jgi:hypothetical protein
VCKPGKNKSAQVGIDQAVEIVSDKHLFNPNESSLITLINTSDSLHRNFGKKTDTQKIIGCLVPTYKRFVISHGMESHR